MGLQVISVLLKIHALRLGNVTVEALVDSLFNFLFLKVQWINFLVYPANSAYAPEVRATYQGFQLHQPFVSELHCLLGNDRDKKASLKESPWMTEIRSGWSLTAHRADLLVLFTFRRRSPAWTQVEEDNTSGRGQHSLEWWLWSSLCILLLADALAFLKGKPVQAGGTYVTLIA